MPPTVVPVEANLIGVESREGTPSEITVGFTITGAFPEVLIENITWIHAGNDITMNSSKYSLSADLCTLTIFNLSFIDSGSITLIARNEAGTGRGTLQLTVYGAHPPLFHTPISIIYCILVEPILLNATVHFNELREGQSAVFSCEVDGSPLPTIVWLHNNTFVTTSNTTRRRIAVSDPAPSFRHSSIDAYSSTLQVSGLRLRDAGQYRCRVDPTTVSGGTSILSAPLELTVLPGEVLPHAIGKIHISPVSIPSTSVPGH